MTSETNMRSTWKLFIGVMSIFVVVGIYMFIVMPLAIGYVMMEAFGEELGYGLAIFVYVYVTGINFLVFNVAMKQINKRVEKSKESRER